MFQLMQILGMCIPCVIFYSISLVLASKKPIASWVLFFVGLILTAFSTFGLVVEDSLNYGQLSHESILFIALFLVITLIFAVMIYKKNKKSGDKNESSSN